jgi:AraC-like DNA-binding protein
MARLTSLLPRDERIDDEAAGLASQPIRIGRLDLEFIRPDQCFTRNWERVSNVHDACYLLAFPLTGSVTFSQDARTGFARPGEYVLLSELAFYELSSDKNARLLMMRIPAAELRGRLVSIEDHVSRRFKPNEQMTRLLVGMIRSVAELFINSPPPNPQALATEIISFVALTIGSEDRGAATDVRNARYHLRRQFVQAKRLQRAYEILVADPRGHRTVSEVAYEVGFKNVSHFSRCFSRHFKVAPRDARQAHNASSYPNKDPRPAAPKGLLAPRVPSPSRGSLASPYWQRRPLHESV